MTIQRHDCETPEGESFNALGPGESMLWQGKPDWRVFARTAFHTRLVGIYFLLLTVLALAMGSIGGAIITVLTGAATLGLLNLLAWHAARSTTYTLTNKRVVMGIGMAVDKLINLPLKEIASAELGERGNGYGDIALELSGRHVLGYAMLWPHARPWRLAQPQPMLRALPDAASIARKLANASAAITEIERGVIEDDKPARVPAGLEEAAA